MLLWNSCSPAHADVRIVYLNKCADIDPVALAAANAISDKRQSYDAVSELWTCLNETQAAQHAETLQQVATAVKNTRFRKNITIYSIDPIYVPKEEAWYFGAWFYKRKYWFAAMPGCPNARRVLEKILREHR